MPTRTHKVYEHLSGEPGTSQTHVDALLANPAIVTEAEKAAAKARAQEEYMAVLLLTKSDPWQYGSLVVDIENQHTRGQDRYPETMSTAYDMLVHYQNPTPSVQLQQQDSGVSFYQHDEDKHDGVPNNSPPHNVGDRALQGMGGQAVMEVMVVVGTQAGLAVTCDPTGRWRDD